MKLRAVFGFCLAVTAMPALAQTRPPIEVFARLPAFSQPRLSPDGKYVAMVQELRGLPVAAIYQVGGPADAKPSVAVSNDWIITRIRWVKNDRLALSLKKSFQAAGDDRIRTWWREVTVSPTGANLVVLNHNQITQGNNVVSAGFVDIDLDDPDHAFMPLYGINLKGDDDNPYRKEQDFRFDILSVDVRTGESRTFMAGKPNTVTWYMDGHGHVLARIDRQTAPLRDLLKYYDGNDWHDAGSFDATADRGTGLDGLSEDGKSVVVERHDDRSMLVLKAQSLAESDQETVLFSNPQYDVDSVIGDDWTDRVVGAAYADDRMEYVYFDPQREALQRGLEQAFPNLSVVAVSSDLARDTVVVAVDGPKKPLTYYLLDRDTHSAQVLASSYPGLDAADLGEMKPYPYKARDGLDIHAYLTLPPGSAGRNMPLVVMPHGGPDARDMLRFDWIGQFFANRGYAVFQPNYRGSSGYGHTFTEAGLHQWGLKMQDDITDGVKKLIADGVVDPKRVCIVGGSYGGYAALAGATFTPDLYACAVSFAGVSDLPKMLQSERNESGQDSQAVSFWTSRIGSQYDDSEQLRATSPARHADQVKCPVLLMHGEGDTTVRVEQGEIEYAALQNAHKNVQFIRVPGEDHYFTRASTRAQFLTEVEKFLAAHIGPTSTASN